MIEETGFLMSNLSDDMKKEGIGGDIERDSQEHITRSLVQLTINEITIDVDLE